MKTKSRVEEACELRVQLEQARARLAEMESTLRAIRSGEVDAIVVNGPRGNQIFTLETADQPYRVLTESMNEGAATLTREGTILFCNRRLAEMLDYPAETLVGASMVGHLVLGGENGLERLVERALLGNTRTEGELVRRNGKHVPVLLSLNKVPLGDAADGVCLVVTDLSTQKQQFCALRDAQDEIRQMNQDLELRVEQRTVELKAAIAELEAFSYSVSHDLRAPLRAIEGFSRFLLQDHAPVLNEDGRHCVEMVRQGAQHMGQLIDGLLAFSRLGRRNLVRRSVKTAELVKQALAELQGEQENRQIKLVVQELPLCYADALLLRLVFVNLLSNALKYTRPRKLAEITVGAMSFRDLQPTLLSPNPLLPSSLHRDDCVFYVRDNGVGFDLQYANKLFGVFQRLHRREEFEGTGVGLATVKRIIHKHGGQVWAEAKPDEGATFFFTLGKPPVGSESRVGTEQLVPA